MTIRLLFLLLLPIGALAQSFSVPVNSASTVMADRLFILSGTSMGIHPELKGLASRDLADYARFLQAKSDSLHLTKGDLSDLAYLSDQWSMPGNKKPKPIGCCYYRTQAHLFELHLPFKSAKPAFTLQVNPVLNFRAGNESGDHQSTIAFQQRGIEVKAALKGRFYLSSTLTGQNQQFAEYVNRRIDLYEAVPGAGAYETYSSSILNMPTARRYGLNHTYLGVQATKHIGVQVGHGTQFIGNGYRSVLMSDFAPPAWFLKVNTRIWKFHYQNLFTKADVGSGVTGNARKKFTASHYLSLQLKPNLSVGLFETTVLGRANHFEFQYLNPVILYRSVEGIIGSPDNILIGMNGRWNILRRFQVYGQLGLDEFVFKELLARNGWWANKYAIQAGVKYINAFGVDHLDVQLEWNSARPYMWSHFDTLNTYSHYSQPLAHVLGSNFKEMIGRVRWQPAPPFTVNARLIYMQTSDDPAGKNYGNNILLSYQSRVQDYGNFIGQGIGANTLLLGLDISWEFYRNTFLDLNVLLRQKKSDVSSLSLDSRIFSAGIRMNAWNTNLDF